MSIDNTSLLDANNHEKQQKILLEFLHDMYLMTDTQQTAHLSVVQNKLTKGWETSRQVNESRSLTLWEKVSEEFRRHSHAALRTDSDVVDLIRWAFSVRKLVRKIEESMDEQEEHYGVELWIGEWEGYDDDY
jgi:hypothetical protein